MNFVAKSVHRVFHDAEIRSKFLVLHQNSGALSLQKWWVFYGFLSFSGDPTLKSLAFPGFPGPALENPSANSPGSPRRNLLLEIYGRYRANHEVKSKEAPPRLGEWR
jgi:hypothetical protein